MHPRAITLRYPFDGNYPVTFRFSEEPTDKVLMKKFLEWGIKGHNGIDFGLPLGTNVLASDSGKVVQAGETGDFGICITLQHAWGTSLYAHLKETKVSPNQHIIPHQIIGLSGQSGFTTGPHLHFGIKPLGVNLDNGYLGFINPEPYLRKSRLQYSH